jgi:hypothetical protein
MDALHAIGDEHLQEAVAAELNAVVYETAVKDLT